MGSNLDKRAKNIKLAVKEISGLKGTKIIKVSKLIETVPVGGPRNQHKFLNAALKIRTSLSPAVLLKNLKDIEKKLGRIKSGCNGPRIIDLDILLYSDRKIKTNKLSIPHPRMWERNFVIKPLLEVL